MIKPKYSFEKKGVIFNKQLEYCLRYDNTIEYFNSKGELINKVTIEGKIDNTLYLFDNKLVYNIGKFDKIKSKYVTHLRILDLRTGDVIYKRDHKSNTYMISKGLFITDNITRDTELLNVDKLSITCTIKNRRDNTLVLEGKNDSSIYVVSFDRPDIFKKINLEDGKVIWSFSIKDIKEANIDTVDLTSRLPRIDGMYLYDDSLFITLKSANVLIVNSSTGEFIKYLKFDFGGDKFYVDTDKKQAYKLYNSKITYIDLETFEVFVKKIKVDDEKHFNYNYSYIVYLDNYILFKHAITSILYIIDHKTLEVRLASEYFQISPTKRPRGFSTQEDNIFLPLLYMDYSTDYFDKNDVNLINI